jgi:hypothetical protein
MSFGTGVLLETVSDKVAELRIEMAERASHREGFALIMLLPLDFTAEAGQYPQSNPWGWVVAVTLIGIGLGCFGIVLWGHWCLVQFHRKMRVAKDAEDKGDYQNALRMLLSADASWTFNVTRQTCASYVNDIDHLRDTVQAIRRVGSMAGITLDVNELEAAITDLRSFYADRSNFWVDKITLKSGKAAIRRARIRKLDEERRKLRDMIEKRLSKEGSKGSVR